VSTNALPTSVKIISEAFYEIVRVYEKNRRLIITNNIEKRYSKLAKEVVINRFHFKMQLLSEHVRILASLSFSKTATALRTR